MACLVLFALSLACALVLDVSLLWALGFGFCLFFAHAAHLGVPTMRLWGVCWQGVRTVAPILTTFVLVGMLTAVWRASGTIAFLVDLFLSFVSPALFLPSAFVLNCALSFLLGSSFATTATLGVITMSLGTALHIDPALSGGAILAGVYFGDRGSPMSTSALLVATVTGTNIYDNVRLMWLSCRPGLVLALAGYAVLSFFVHGEGALPDTASLFAGEYSLTPLLSLPALLMLALALMKVGVRLAMGASIAAALFFCLVLQDLNISRLPALLLFGFEAKDPAVAPLMNGGGILSFATVAGIVCLSATYAGLFKEGRLLDCLSPLVDRLAEKCGLFAPFLCLGTVISALACNQTLPIMLSQQLTSHLPLGKNRRAIDIEDTAVLLPAIIPWSMACAIPLQMLGAPNTAILFALYIWLVPLTRLFHTPKSLQTEPSA